MNNMFNCTNFQPQVQNRLIFHLCQHYFWTDTLLSLSLSYFSETLSLNFWTEAKHNEWKKIISFSFFSIVCLLPLIKWRFSDYSNMDWQKYTNIYLHRHLDDNESDAHPTQISIYNNEISTYIYICILVVTRIDI